MKPRDKRGSDRNRGYAMLIVMVLGGLGLFALASTLLWAANSARLNERSSQYYTAVAAAEAATEQVLTWLNRDFQKKGPAVLTQRLPEYRAKIPQTDDYYFWGNYTFDNGKGLLNETDVEILKPWGVYPLISQYVGLSGYAATYQITSNA